MDHTRRLNDTYLLLEQLGEGGGGIVYKAYHERLRTEVVVKQVKERVKGKIVGRGEADVLKKLKHPYLPRVYDFLEVDGEIYTVMDYIPGDNLGNVLKKTPGFAQKEVLAWAKQLAEALAYLHGQEPPIIHSDIKPDNVMLLPDGKVCLIDFNISLAFDPSMRTATGISKGYSPPEQFSPDIYFESIHPDDLECTNTAVLTDQLEELPAETAVMPAWNDAVAVIAQSKEKLTDTVSMIDQTIGRGVDERSDIYSLGATLYHLLTGIKPDYNFQNVKPISQCGIRISEGFSHIIEKMMAILPEDRYQNGSELLNALEHIYEADHMYVDYRRKKRRRGIAIASLYILAAGCVGAGVVTLNWERNTAYNRAVEEADTLIEVGDFGGAEIELGIALSKIPQRIDAYGKEVYRLYSMGDYDACIKYTKDILNNPQYMIGKGSDNDIEILGDIYYILGNSYFEKEDYGNARSCFEQALEYNQKNSFYYRDYAVVMAKTGNSEQAEVMLNQAVALGLGQDSVYFVMGEIAYSNGEYEAAIDYLRKTLDIAGSNQIKKRSVMLCAKAYESCGDDFLKEEINLLDVDETRRAINP